MSGYVSVCGPSAAAAPLLDAAETVGRGLAQRGHVVVCGGLGGVMTAVARGAAEAGGVVVGYLPGLDRRAANPHVTIALPTGLGEMRNPLIVRAADVVVCVGGSWGTLSEVALAVRTGVPVVAIDGWSFLTATGDDVVDEPGILRAADPDEALELVDRWLPPRPAGLP